MILPQDRRRSRYPVLPARFWSERRWAILIMRWNASIKSTQIGQFVHIAIVMFGKQTHYGIINHSGLSLPPVPNFHVVWNMDILEVDNNSTI